MNILKKFWRSIATRFIPQMLCASLKEHTNSVYINKKSDIFDYGEIIEKYYNGNKKNFMDEKDEYNSKLNRVRELIDKTKYKTIGYSEFIELKKLLNELNIVSKNELSEIFSEYGYDSEKLFENIVDFSDKSKVDKIKTSEIIGKLSGSVLQAEYAFVNNYTQFLKKVKGEK